MARNYIRHIKTGTAFAVALVFQSSHGFAKSELYFKCDSITGAFERFTQGDGSVAFRLPYEKGDLKVVPMNVEALKEPENVCAKGCRVTATHWTGDRAEFQTQTSMILLGLQASSKIEEGVEAIETIYFRSAPDKLIAVQGLVVLPGKNVIIRKESIHHLEIDVTPITGRHIAECLALR